MTISDENTDNQQGAWMPGLLWVKMLGIQFQSYTCLNGASGLLAFDKNVYTNVLHSTYCHWMIYRKNFLVLDYHTTDGSHRTNANLAGWNWKKEKEQEFDSGLKEPEYPALKECWAVVIAASRGWSNYRHQADALAFYQLLKSRGYDDEHIILIEEDDIAGHPSNFDPGKVYISPDGTDVYEGAVIDYKLSELSPADLVDIFCGNVATVCLTLSHPVSRTMYSCSGAAMACRATCRGEMSTTSVTGRRQNCSIPSTASGNTVRCCGLWKPAMQAVWRKRAKAYRVSCV